MRYLLASLLLTAACINKTRPAEPAAPTFRDIAHETGLVFQHVNGATGQLYMPEIMGSGAALFDFDNDGDLDVLLIQGGSVEHPATGVHNRLFRNELIPSGKLTFTDVTANSGLQGSEYGMGVAVADIDNDGRPDLLITNYGANHLYRNEGGGRFKDVTAESPAVRRESYWSSSAAFFDYDRDGWQDLVILSYVDFTIRGNKKCSAPTGEPDYCTPVAYRPEAAALFHNEHGRFVDVTSKAGLDRARGPGLGVVAIDVDRDGWLDLFVANDTTQNHLWINQRDGTFRESALEHGIAYGEEGQPKAGMGVAAGDYDRDGFEDLLVLNLMREGASLFRNDGKGFFTDVSLKTRIHGLTLPYTGFGAGWFDYDNDGCPDVFMSNGAVTLREGQRAQGRSPYAERNLLLRGSCGLKPFEDVTPQAGPDMNLLEVTRAAAFADIDNDGRVDILITTNNGPARLLHNETRPIGNWLSIDVAKPATKVGIFPAGTPPQWKTSRTDGSYLSASEPRLHFGLADAVKIDRLVIERPDGTRQEMRHVQANRIIHPNR